MQRHHTLGIQYLQGQETLLPSAAVDGHDDIENAMKDTIVIHHNDDEVVDRVTQAE